MYATEVGKGYKIRFLQNKILLQSLKIVSDIYANWQEKLEVGFILTQCNKRNSATQWEYNVRFTWKVD